MTQPRPQDVHYMNYLAGMMTQAGLRQVQGYADHLNQEFPGTPFTYRVITYDQP